MVIRERVEWVYLVSTGPQKYQSISSDDFYHLNFRTTILYLTEASEVTPAMFCHSLTMSYFICSHLKKSLNWLCNSTQFHTKSQFCSYTWYLDALCSVSFYYYIRFFLCGPFKNSLLNLFQYCFCFMLWVLGCEAYGILAPQPGIKPIPPTLEGSLKHWTTKEVPCCIF